MKTVVFDLDGVLVDSLEANVASFQAGMASIDGPIPDTETVASLLGKHPETMLTAMGCPAERAHEVYVDTVWPVYHRELPAKVQAFAGARDLLLWLRNQEVGVLACTSGELRVQQPVLEQLDLWPLIDDIQTPCQSEYRKPEAEFLQELLERNQRSGAIVHVEDAGVGLAMGKKVGATTVYARYGFADKEAEIPDFTIDSLNELQVFLKQLWF